MDSKDLQNAVLVNIKELEKLYHGEIEGLKKQNTSLQQEVVHWRELYKDAKQESDNKDYFLQEAKKTVKIKEFVITTLETIIKKNSKAHQEEVKELQGLYIPQP